MLEKLRPDHLWTRRTSPTNKSLNRIIQEPARYFTTYDNAAKSISVTLESLVYSDASPARPKSFLAPFAHEATTHCPPEARDHRVPYAVSDTWKCMTSRLRKESWNERHQTRICSWRQTKLGVRFNGCKTALFTPTNIPTNHVGLVPDFFLPL